MNWGIFKSKNVALEFSTRTSKTCWQCKMIAYVAGNWLFDMIVLSNVFSPKLSKTVLQFNSVHKIDISFLMNLVMLEILLPYPRFPRHSCRLFDESCDAWYDTCISTISSTFLIELFYKSCYAWADGDVLSNVLLNVALLNIASLGPLTKISNLSNILLTKDWCKSVEFASLMVKSLSFGCWAPIAGPDFNSFEGFQWCLAYFSNMSMLIAVFLDSHIKLSLFFSTIWCLLKQQTCTHQILLMPIIVDSAS